MGFHSQVDNNNSDKWLAVGDGDKYTESKDTVPSSLKINRAICESNLVTSNGSNGSIGGSIKSDQTTFNHYIDLKSEMEKENNKKDSEYSEYYLAFLISFLILVIYYSL